VQTRLLSGDGLSHGQERHRSSATCDARPSPRHGATPETIPAVAVGARGISSMPLLTRGHPGAYTAVRSLSQHESLADVGVSTHVEVSMEGGLMCMRLAQQRSG